jgi:hypothetical protein
MGCLENTILKRYSNSNISDGKFGKSWLLIKIFLSPLPINHKSYQE